MRYSFTCDYSTGAHPQIFEALLAVNEAPQHGVYGEDDHSLHAAALIRALVEQPEAEVVFLSGGTQTNLTALSYALRPWEAVVAATSGHIAVHETGAIELTGHKVIAVPTENGKLTPTYLEEVMEEHALNVHMVVPRVVFISQSTEWGGLYSRAELEALRAYCDAHELLLHLDGARLGFALASVDNDVTLKDIGALTDSFYMGGTKAGAMMGEALVLLHPSLRTTRGGIRHAMKQRGALLAKGWMLGIQFEVLLRHDMALLMEGCTHANRMVAIIREAMRRCGHEPVDPARTNMVFYDLPVALVEKIETQFRLSREKEMKNMETGKVERVLVRFVGAWNTKEEECHKLAALLLDSIAFQP